MHASTSQSSQPQVTPERLTQFAFAYAPPVMISTALELGVFDALESGPKSASELAKTLKVSERGLPMLMNGLVAFEFLAKDGDRYSLTPESAAFLVSSKPAYIGGLFRNICTRQLPAWLFLADVVRTGQPVQDVTGGADAGEFLRSFRPFSRSIMLPRRLWRERLPSRQDSLRAFSISRRVPEFGASPRRSSILRRR